MRIIITSLLLMLFHSIGNAQIMQLFDPVANRPFNADLYAGIKGSPFVIDKWQKGSVSVAKGMYTGLELKLDGYDNKVFFNKDDQSFEFNEAILSFILMPKPADSSSYRYFIKGLSSSSLSPNQYVEVLVDGKAVLYRSDIKSVTEMSEINAGMVKSFITTTRYYLKKGSTIQFLKLNKSDVLSMLNDQAQKINEFISKEKLGLKKESELIRLINYYNTL